MYCNQINIYSRGSVDEIIFLGAGHLFSLCAIMCCFGFESYSIFCIKRLVEIIGNKWKRKAVRSYRAVGKSLNSDLGNCEERGQDIFFFISFSSMWEKKRSRNGKHSGTELRRIRKWEPLWVFVAACSLIAVAHWGRKRRGAGSSSSSRVLECCASRLLPVDIFFLTFFFSSFFSNGIRVWGNLTSTAYGLTKDSSFLAISVFFLNL